MEIARALQELGAEAAALSEQEYRQLDEQGYVLLQAVLEPEAVERMRARQAQLLKEEGDRGGSETYTEPGTLCLADLVNKGEEFRVVFTHPRVLAAVSHVLSGDLKLSSINSRSALPGRGLQGLHADWEEPAPPGEYQVCNSIWMLDDFTVENGATRILPGSHLSGEVPQKTLADPSLPYPGEALILGRAGDVAVFNAHAWHGGTTNRTQGPRRALHGYFCRRHQPAQLDQERFLRPETRASLSEAALTVLGVSDPEKPALP